MVDYNLNLCAKYPFTSEAKAFVSVNKPQISPPLIELGQKRILSALLKGEIPKQAVVLDAKELVYSYAVARMIISQFSRFHINRYAIAEAKRASSLLESSLRESSGLQDSLLVLGGLGIHAKIVSEKPDFIADVPVFEYLRFAPRSVDYKLINQNVSGGFVRSLTWHKVCRIAEEAIKIQIQNSLPLKIPKTDYPQEILKAAKEIDKLLPREESVVITKIPSENFPPCIVKLLQDMHMHENLPHTARWFLATYLLKAGVKPEEIAAIFKDAPDYNEETTRYQIDYLVKKTYSVPNCDSIDSYGLCVAECGTKNPLQFKAAYHGKKVERDRRERDANQKRDQEQGEIQ
ncbi:DNA primase large subunit PriL [Candidatus Gugararchaeum adminiculabundum]|nr:DNA primase large subunit PriL [Candidatus Gugararchaeum adminiculabundum]